MLSEGTDNVNWRCRRWSRTQANAAGDSVTTATVPTANAAAGGWGWPGAFEVGLCAPSDGLRPCWQRGHCHKHSGHKPATDATTTTTTVPAAGDASRRPRIMPVPVTVTALAPAASSFRSAHESRSVPACRWQTMPGAGDAELLRKFTDPRQRSITLAITGRFLTFQH